MIKELTLEPIPGIQIGHEQDDRARTGCTVVLCEDGAVAGFDLRGSAPGTRETELLRPGFLVEEIHGILLTGGSAFGLDAAGGVQKYLEERGKGFDSRGIRIPIVPAGVIFDLHIGYSRIRPNKDMAYRACEKSRQDMVKCGLVGAGTGATVGKIAGMENAMSGGVGYASEKLPSGLIVSSLAVVNALGDVIDIDTHEIIAGAKNPATDGFLNTSEYIRREQVQAPLGPENTTLAVVMTNAKLNKMEINKVAQMAQNGLARVIRPAHTMFDGDLVFSLSCGELNSDVNLIGDMAAATLAQAIITAVKISNGIE
jgi:L-aminopeptidase/D-esterase-like protein